MNTKTKTLTVGLSAVLIAGGAGLCTLPQEAQALTKPDVSQPIIDNTGTHVIKFKDKTLKDSILFEMKTRGLIDSSTQDITKDDALKVTELTAITNTNAITSIEGLENFKNLTVLNLNFSQISDLTPLAGLTKLKDLELNDNQIADITPLAGLTKLTQLWLANNQISDLTPLAGLTKLTYLVLCYNPISDVTPLASLTNLETLNLHDNNISDISPLASLTIFSKLKVVNQTIMLHPTSNKIDLAKEIKGAGKVVFGSDENIVNGALTHKDGMQNPYVVTAKDGENYSATVKIDFSKAKSPIIQFKDGNLKNAILTEMKKQNLIDQAAQDITKNDALKVKELSTWDESIKSIDGLENFKNLTKLSVLYSKISDFTPIAGLTKLTDLWLGDLMNSVDLSLCHLEISDLSFLTNLTKLEHLSLINCGVSNLEPLTKLPKLAWLEVSRNPLGKNIETVTKIENLTQLIAAEAEINDCNFLTRFKNPEKCKISLERNHITFLPKFAPNTKFGGLILSENSILDFSPLKNISDSMLWFDGQKVVLDSPSKTYDMSKLPNSVRVSEYALDEDECDGVKPGVIDKNTLKPANGEKSGVFWFRGSDELKGVVTDDCKLVINFNTPNKQPQTPPVVDNSQSGETYDDGADAPRTPEPFITARNLIKELHLALDQTLEQNKDKYTNEQLAALNTKLADYEKQLKAITDSKENIATRVTKARKLVTELQEMRANPLSVIKGKVEKQNTDKAKEEKAEKTDKKPIDKIEKTDNLHDKRVFDKDKDKGEKQKGKLPKTSDTAPIGVVGLLAGMLGILAVKPKREKL